MRLSTSAASRRKRRHVLSVASVAAAQVAAPFAMMGLLSQQAEATPYYWDVNGTTAGFSTVVGAWNTGAFWGPNASGTGGTYIVNPTAADDLNFVTATTNTGTITVTGAKSASSLTFVAGVGAVTISGGTSITVGGTGALSGIFKASTSAQIISTPVILNAASTSLNFTNSAAGLLTIGAVTGAGAGAQTVTVSSTAAGGITLNGIIGNSTGGGTVALTINNTSTGATVLSGANTYTGGTTLTAGTLNLNNAAALGGTASLFTINGGTIDNSTTAAITLANNNAQVWGGSFTFTGTSGLNMGAGAVNMTGSRTVTVNANTLTVGGVISGAASVLTKAGAGTLALSGANTYGGGTVVSAGALSFLNTTAKSATGTHDFAAGTTLGLGVSGASAFTSADIDNAFAGSMTGSLSGITVAATTNIGLDTTNGSFTYASSVPITTRGLTKLGANTLTITGANAYDGPTLVMNGTLSVASLNSVVGGTASSNLGAPTTAANGTISLGSTNTAGTLSYTGTGETTDRVINLAGTTGGGVLDQSGTGLLKFTGNMTLAAGTKAVTFSGSTTGTGEYAGTIPGTISTGTNPLTIVKSGTGTWSLTGTGNTATTLSISGGTINTGPGGLTLGNVGASTINTTGATAGSTVFVNGLITLNGVATAANNGADIGAIAGVTLDLSGAVIAGTVANANLDFNPTGTVILGNANTYQGQTSINGGGIVVNVTSLGTANGALPSSLGQPAAGNSITGNLYSTILMMNGTLKYVGTGETTDRALDLRGTTTAAILDQSGTGLLKFTGTNTAGGVGTKVWTLQGSTTGIGEIAGAIVDNLTGTNTTGVTKAGTGTWTLSGVNTYTGPTTVNAGTLSLAGTSGSIASSVTINGGTFLLDNLVGANNGNRLADAGTITLAAGGTLDFSNDAAAATNYSETTGVLNINTGGGTIIADQAAVGQTSSLTFASLANTSGATLNFTGTGLGVDARNRVLFTAQAPGNLPVWARYNTTEFAAYDATNGIVAATYTDINTMSSVVPNTAGATVRINNVAGVANNTLGATTTTINALIQNAAGPSTLDMGATGILRTTGIVIEPGKQSLTIGATAGDGTLTAATAGGLLTLSNNSSNTLAINSAIADNTSASNVVLNNAGVMKLAGANTYTGNTIVNGGTLNITGSLTGLVASSALRYGDTPGNTVVNISGNVNNYFVFTGSNAVGSTTVMNQTAGSVTIVPTTGADVQWVAKSGYGGLNITGGSFNTGRFDVVAPGGTAGVGVVYVGGGGTLNNNVGDWLILPRTNGIGQLTVGPGGNLVRSAAVTAQLAITMDGTGSYGALNVAGGNVDTGVRAIQFGFSNPGAGNQGFLNLAGGTLSVGLAINETGTTGSTAEYFNFAGGTLKMNAALASFIPATSIAGHTSTSTIYGPITNNNNANAAFNTQIGSTSNFTGGLTVDTNGFATTFTNAFRAASGFAVTQANIGDVSALPGNSGYIGAPAVVFSAPAAGGVPASGYAVIDAATGKVNGIVITNPGTYALNETPTITLSGGGGSIAAFTTSALSTANTAAGITKTGLGTLTLSNATSTYTGGVTINQGTLALGIANAIPAANNVVVNGGTFDAATFANAVNGVSLQSGTIQGSTGVITSATDYDLRSGTVGFTGAGGLGGSVNATKSTSGTVTLTNNGLGSFANTVNINNGTLSFTTSAQLGNASATNGVTLGGGTLQYTGAGAVSLGALRQVALTAGTTGTVEVQNNNGNLQISANGIVATGASAATNFVKTGPGALTVTGVQAVNLQSGGVTVTGGALTAGLHATNTGTVTVGSLGSLQLVDTSPVTITLAGTGTGAITLNGGGRLGFELAGSGSNDSINMTGSNPATTSGVITLDFYALAGFGIGLGNYNLITAPSGLGGASYVLGNAPSGFNYLISSTATTVSLTTSVLSNIYWTNSQTTGSWSTISGGPLSNFSTDLAGSVNSTQVPQAADTVIFSSSAASVGASPINTTLDAAFTIDSLRFTSQPAGATVSIAPGTGGTLNLSPVSSANGITVENNGGAVTISAPLTVGTAQTWSVDGTGTSSLLVSGNTNFTTKVTKTGAGTLTLSGASNTGSGGFTLTGGKLNANSAGALGTGTFTINAGTTIDNTGAGTVTLTGGANVWNGDFTYTGATQSLNLGTGNVTMGANVLLTVAGNTFTVGGAIGDGGNNRSLTKAGAGALTLSTANTIGGGVTLNAGTLNIGNAAALGSNTFTVAGGTIDNTSGSAMTVANALAINGSFAFTGTQNLTFSTPTVTQTVTPDINVTGALAINGNLTSAFGITKSGGGVLSLGGTNTYAGATTISAGSLAVTGSLVTAGGLVFGSANGATVVGNLDLSNGSASFASGLVRTNSATANTVTVGSGKTFTLTGGLTMGYDAGAGTGATFSNLTVSGAGSMSITGTTVNVGTNQAATNAAYWNDSTLDVTALTGGFSANVTNFNIGVGGTTQGPGTVLLSNTSNTLIATTLTAGNTGGNNGRGTGSLIFGTGTNTIQADTINIGVGKNSGPGVMKFASQLAGSPGTVTINNKAGSGAAINVADNNGTATGGGAAGTLDLRGHVSTVNASTLLLGRLNMASNSGGVTANVFFDAGTFTVGTLNMSAKTAAGTGTANSTLTVGGGNFIVNTAFTLGSQATAGAATALLNITGGTFNSNVNILDGGGTTTSTITLDGGTLDMNNKNIGSATLIDVLNFRSGTLRNVAQINNGTTPLTKTTAGTLTLAGTNTYTGATAVNGGTLLVGGSHAGGASYTVATGGTLGGGGVITLAASAASQVLVQSGGTLAPGAGTGIISILNTTPGTGAASTLSLATGSTYAVELNGTTAGTGYDQADVTGTVNIADGSLLTVALGFAPQLTDEFVIIKNDSTDAVGGTNFFASVNGQALSFIGTNLYATSVADANGALYTVNYAGGDGNDVVLTGIPEPTSVALMAMAGLGLLGRRRRRA